MLSRSTTLSRIVAIYVVSILFGTTAAPAGDFAQTAGPSGGSVMAIAAHFNDAWAATSSGSVFRSNDAGATWAHVHSSGIVNNAYFEQIVHLNSGTLLARDRINVFRSIDDGETWSPVNIDFTGATSTKLVADGPAVVALLHGAGDQLFNSSDDGVTWNPVPLPFAAVNDVFFKDDVLVVAPVSFGSLQRSLNLGKVWTPVGVELPSDLFARFAVGQPSLVLQCMFTGRYFRSTNIGQSWLEITPAFAGGFFLPPLAVADGASTMFAAFSESSMLTIYRSVDDGANWQDVSASGLPDVMVSSSQPLPMATGSASSVLLGYGYSGLGVYRSSDAGAQWTDANQGLIATTLDNVGVVGDVLLASSPYLALNYRATDGGASWNKDMTLPDIRTFESTGPATVFAGSFSSGAFRSDNAAGSWTPVNTGLPHFGSTAGDAIQPLNDFATHNGSLFVATGGGSQFIGGDDHCGCTSTISGDGVYRTANNGASWQRVSNGLPVNMIYFGQPILRPVMALQSVNGALLAATPAHGVFRSTNDGASWNATAGAPGGTDFAVFNGAVYLADGDGSLYRSTDDGATWSVVATDLPAAFTFARLHVHNDLLYAIGGTTQFGPSNGIYSTSNATNWQSASNALADVPISDITSSPDGLVVGTIGRGVWIQPDVIAQDINGDGAVNVFDLLILLGAWGDCAQPCPPSCQADITGDCSINVFDLLELLSAWTT